MTPKDKAKELVKKYKSLKCLFEYKDAEGNYYHLNGYLSNSDAKQCAIIAVDELIKALRKDLPEIGLGKGYWYAVKKEIEKL